MQSKGRALAAAVGVVAATIGAHEGAHAVVAVRSGGRVREVGIGFGPALLRVHVRGIPVTIRALPLGGYAAVDVDHLPPQRRIGMLFAGPLANLVLGAGLWLGLRRHPVVTVGQRGRPVRLTGFVGTISALIRAADAGPGALGRLAGAMNVGLGAMNLLPVYPLDGGHIVMNLMERFGMSARARTMFAGITTAAFLWLVQTALLGDLQQWPGGQHGPTT